MDSRDQRAEQGYLTTVTGIVLTSEKRAYGSLVPATVATSHTSGPEMHSTLPGDGTH